MWDIDNIWTLHSPNNPKTSQGKKNVNAKVMVEKLFFSSLTYTKTWALSACFVNTSFTCNAMALLDVFEVSKKLIITWQGLHLSFKKWTIKANVSNLNPLTSKDQNMQCACTTRFKGWRYKQFICLLGNPKQNINLKLFP